MREIEKKYEITNEKIEFEGKILYRIIALRDFGNVKAGELGGYVQSEENLSQEGTCWLFGDSKAYDNARVGEDAILLDNARVYNNATICSNAIVYGNASVFEYGRVTGNARICGDANIFGNAIVCQGAEVSGSAAIYGNATVAGEAMISGYSTIYDNAEISGYANVKNAEIGSSAKIVSDNDYFSINLNGESSINITAFKLNTGRIWINHEEFFSGHFECELSNFESEIASRAVDEKECCLYKCIIEMIKQKFHE